ncbi:MAG TPA: TIGR02996 domain-containing protein [Gemmata sp.]
MSPDEGAFLKAIADNPADEPARLAFADWLRDCGDPRAGFVKLSADFLRCLRELGEQRPALPPEWAEVVDPLFNRVRFVLTSWEHADGDTRVCHVNVAPGEFIRRGHVLATLESDRMAEEVCAAEPGVVVAILIEPCERVPFGRPLLAYLRMPVELPLPQSAPPAVPLRKVIAELEARREKLRAGSAEQLARECAGVSAAIQMVFGRRALLQAFAQARTQGRVPPVGASGAEKELAHFGALIDALRTLLAQNGQPTGFAERPDAPG